LLGKPEVIHVEPISNEVGLQEVISALVAEPLI
jgi:hypothetical protein